MIELPHDKIACNKFIIGTLLISFFFFTACVPSLKSHPIGITNSPNHSPIHNIPDSVEPLRRFNHLLAYELLKLPELQDGITSIEIKAVNKIYDLSEMHPESLNDAFNEMYEQGIPQIRKYCAPLQAFFWLALKQKPSDLRKLVLNFNLDTLLSNAWTVGFEEAVYSYEDLLFIAEHTINSAIKKSLIQALAEAEIDKAKTFLLNYYRYNQSVYSEEAIKVIEKDVVKNKQRWGDLPTVADRLNSPYLLLFWMKKNIKYGWPGRPDMAKWEYLNPQTIFSTGEGECVSQSGFEAVILKRNGYDAHLMFVNRIEISRNDHAICYWKEDNKYYYIESAWVGRRGLYGPFDSKDQIAGQIYSQLEEHDNTGNGYNFVSFDHVPYNSCWEFFSKSLIINPN